MTARPYLHEHVTSVRAPATWLSTVDGQMRGGRSVQGSSVDGSLVDGLYVADRRVLSRLEVAVDGVAPTALKGGATDADSAAFVGALPGLGNQHTPDPTVWCERIRRTYPDGGEETIALRNAAGEPVSVSLTVLVASDLLPVSVVKGGRAGTPFPATLRENGFAWRAPDGLRVSLTAAPVPASLDAGSGTLTWHVTLDPGVVFEARLRVVATPPDTVGFRPLAPVAPVPWRSAPLTVRADDRRLDALVRVGVADLDALLLADSLDPTDAYAAAGSPWYLTLFARDALWAALLSLPLGHELAGGTLRTLARRQGSRADPSSEEAPGKILHELRPVDAAIWLPPVYYGTVDATPLFVNLLARAWRWGLPTADVAALLPAAERALEWLATYGDPDGDGFVAYVPSGAGLTNQGWKDSGDGVQSADGRLPVPPVALAEVQAYAHRAARDGADLLDAYGRPGGTYWREWADRLAERFRDAFWVSDVDGPYPAIALEAGKSPVDGPASNMGHLLGTGLLSPSEESLVAARLVGPAMNSGYGLRTLADTAAGFNPLSYHAGSVWPHDTAIAILGLVRSGHATVAARLLGGLLDAAPAFDFRLPELYGGFSAGSGLAGSGAVGPVPYPAACRPQAWSAAVGPAFVQALLGLDVDAPNGVVSLAPMSPSPVGAYEVTNIRLGSGTLSVRVDAAGHLVDVVLPPGLALLPSRL